MEMGKRTGKTPGSQNGGREDERAIRCGNAAMGARRCGQQAVVLTRQNRGVTRTRAADRSARLNEWHHGVSSFRGLGAPVRFSALASRKHKETHG